MNAKLNKKAPPKVSFLYNRFAGFDNDEEDNAHNKISAIGLGDNTDRLN